VKFRRHVGGALVLITCGSAWMAHAQNPSAGRLVPRTAAPAPPAPPAAIAVVGGRRVSKDEFKAREAQALGDYKARLGQDVPEDVKPVVRRQLLESLIRRELLVLEAQKRGVTGTDAEAEAELRKEPFFNPNGQFDPQRYNVIKTTQPENYAKAIASIKVELGAKKLADQLEREYGGSEASMKSAVERSMGTVSYDLLALRRSEIDGSYREPRETEILDAYRRSPENWKKSAEAKLTVLVVDQPPLDEGADGGARSAWNSRMRARADSAIAALRKGAPLEELAKDLGSLHRDVTVTPDNFPGYWRGDAKDAAALFATPAGGVLGSAVPGTSGWLVVHVDEQKPGRVAPLKDVAREIRGTLRTEARNHGEDGVLRQMYEEKKSRLRTTGWKIRYAVFDTSAAIADPTPAELDRWYRAHQADFSSFDASAGAIRVRPLAEVHDVAVTRWKSERRHEGARIAAETLRDAWKRGVRDRNAEKGLALHEAGPLVPGAPIDASPAGKTLADTLAGRPFEIRADAIAWASGWIVYHVYESVPNYVPAFEQMRAELATERAAALNDEAERGAKALYDADPSAFAARNVIDYTRYILPRIDPSQVPLSRAQVAKYYREHIDRYSAPEVVRVRHILITPKGEAADAIDQARAKAQELLQRAKGGEDFAALARKYSDDVATREKGGDLGDFGRGTMLPEFEEAAFKMQPGDLVGPVRTEAGFHVLLCVAHEPLSTQDLRYAYSNVGWDAAQQIADSLMNHRADSLASVCRTPAQVRAAAARLHGTLDPTFHEVGDRRALPDLVPFLIRLEHTKPGQVVPGSAYDRSAGHYIAWVDSISPARTRTWDAARQSALDLYRRGAAQRALDAKRAEIDSLLASGWSVDSVATLWGGWEKVQGAAPGSAVAGLGGSEIADSLLFGSPRHPPVLSAGQTSGWVALPGGLARIRLLGRGAPDASRITAVAENERRIQVEQKLEVFFDGLKKRYPIEILDDRLRDTPLPPPPTSRLSR